MDPDVPLSDVGGGPAHVLKPTSPPAGRVSVPVDAAVHSPLPRPSRTCEIGEVVAGRGGRDDRI